MKHMIKNKYRILTVAILLSGNWCSIFSSNERDSLNELQRALHEPPVTMVLPNGFSGQLNDVVQFVRLQHGVQKQGVNLEQFYYRKGHKRVQRFREGPGQQEQSLHPRRDRLQAIIAAREGDQKNALNNNNGGVTQ